MSGKQSCGSAFIKYGSGSAFADSDSSWNIHIPADPGLDSYPVSQKWFQSLLNVSKWSFMFTVFFHSSKYPTLKKYILCWPLWYCTADPTNFEEEIKMRIEYLDVVPGPQHWGKASFALLCKHWSIICAFVPPQCYATNKMCLYCVCVEPSVNILHYC